MAMGMFIELEDMHIFRKQSSWKVHIILEDG